MSQEIEHFETRIARVEDYIRQNRLGELVTLVRQLQESLKVVRDLSFFEKQKQRIERFDKAISTYAEGKRAEVVGLPYGQFRTRGREIRALVALEGYFGREREFMESLVKERFLKELSSRLSQEVVGELPREYDETVKGYTQKLTFKFCIALTQFLEKEASFFDECFDEATVKRSFYEILITKALSDYRDKLIPEFLSGFPHDLRPDIFTGLYLKLISSLKRLTQSETSAFPFLKDLYQAVLESAKLKFTTCTQRAFERIMELDSEHAQPSAWESAIKPIFVEARALLSENIETGLCYELQTLIAHMFKALERFLMQICLHIGQISNKRMHFGVPSVSST